MEFRFFRRRDTGCAQADRGVHYSLVGRSRRAIFLLWNAVTAQPSPDVPVVSHDGLAVMVVPRSSARWFLIAMVIVLVTGEGVRAQQTTKGKEFFM
ncbi:MAG: hypothetical protein ACKOAX_00480, partial [Candidatus Kapaibacterium sp.]